LTVEAKDRTVNVWTPFEKARVVDKVAGSKIVRAIEDNVVETHQCTRIACVEAHWDGVDGNQRIAGAHPLRRGGGFLASYVGLTEDRLALQVRFVNGVVINHADTANPGGRKVLQRRRAKAARADHKHARRCQPFLSAKADFRYQEMPAIAAERSRVHADRCPEG
jgi:hypothetical protein